MTHLKISNDENDQRISELKCRDKLKKDEDISLKTLVEEG